MGRLENKRTFGKPFARQDGSLNDNPLHSNLDKRSMTSAMRSGTARAFEKVIRMRLRATPGAGGHLLASTLVRGLQIAAAALERRISAQLRHSTTAFTQ